MTTTGREVASGTLWMTRGESVKVFLFLFTSALIIIIILAFLNIRFVYV